MAIYYRVKQDNFMWKKGAILKCSDGGVKVTAIEDIWNTTPAIAAEYISLPIIACPSNAEYFERVYPDTLTGRLFKTKDQMINLYKESFSK